MIATRRARELALSFPRQGGRWKEPRESDLTQADRYDSFRDGDRCGTREVKNGGRVLRQSVKMCAGSSEKRCGCGETVVAKLTSVGKWLNASKPEPWLVISALQRGVVCCAL